MNQNPPLDLLIIGGGINGTGIACDAAGRGLSVHLCEQNDLASGTSSKSTKLIHGGLRYLEYYQFHLVRESLIEREILLRKAPHLIWPLSFVLPHHPKLRPIWMIRLGLFLYDHLAKRSILPKSKYLTSDQTTYFEPLNSDYHKGFLYPDCWVDDARLVVTNAISAHEMGAKISTYCKVENLKRSDGLWQAQIFDQIQNKSFTINAKAVVNATGPWTEPYLTQHHIRLVKGSHIVVPKLYEGEHAYILQQADNRIVFAIPYEQHWTLIGTTDVDYTGDPSSAEISPDEINYLCQIINTYFNKKISTESVVWHYSGVRPLFDSNLLKDPKSVSRDFSFELTDENGQLPLLSILGGKITTYRILAEQALHKLKPYFPNMGPDWTASAPLPGGDIADADFEEFYITVKNKYPNLPEELLHRLARQYGTKINTLLENVFSVGDLGKDYGATLYQREIDYLKKYEWLHTKDDLLYRRTKLGLHFTAGQKITNLNAGQTNQMEFDY
jgi:glycerol-3-phosphate dehydrogenase